MHSHLRSQSTFSPFSAHTTAASFPHTITARPEKRQKMSITQTYRLAHRARGKLSYEASRGDHDLRLLVGHANLLDGLMLDLQEAEKDQEAWFTSSFPAAKEQEQTPKVTFVEQHRLEVPDVSDEEEGEDSASDSEDEAEETAQPIQIAPRRQQRARSPPARLHTYAEESDDDEEAMESDDDYDNLELALVRTRSHSGHEQEMAVPELVHDHSDDSDDDSAPSSPDEPMALGGSRITVKDFAAVVQQKRQEQLHKDVAEAMEIDDFYLPSREQHAPTVTAY